MLGKVAYGLEHYCICPSNTPWRFTFNPNSISNQGNHLPNLAVKRFIHNLLKQSQGKISWLVLFLVVLAVAFSNITYAGKYTGGSLLFSTTNLGGPMEASFDSIGIIQGTLGVPGDENDPEPVSPSESNVILALNAPEGYSEENASRIIRDYTIQEGDDLKSISAKFGISEETIAIENNIKDLAASLQPGSTLRILPINGITQEVSENTSLEELASRYQVSTDYIKEFNSIQSDDLAVGARLVIPDAVVPNTEKPFYKEPVRLASNRNTRTRAATTSPSRSSVSSIPEIAGYFGYPTTGRNYGVLHSSNGVDISNSCGTPIYASAEGTVTTSQDGWNGGYGSYIKITHPNGVVTLYGHLSVRLSSIGQNVAKGELIGHMGTTGRSTGCHLHFEVRGAANPLAR